MMNKEKYVQYVSKGYAIIQHFSKSDRGRRSSNRRHSYQRKLTNKQVSGQARKQTATAAAYTQLIYNKYILDVVNSTQIPLFFFWELYVIEGGMSLETST